MGYFPFFIDIAGRKGLIVGGGAVAVRKVQKLLPYSPRLTVAAPDICPELEAISGLELLREPFSPGMLDGAFFVIAAAGSLEVNRRVAQLCREKNILVNVADSKDECAFLFPALVKRGELSVGISTAGSSPSAAAWLRTLVEELVPEDFEATLDFLRQVRPLVRDTLPADSHAAAFSRLFDACMQAGGPLSREESETILAGFRTKTEDGI